MASSLKLESCAGVGFLSLASGMLQADGAHPDSDGVCVAGEFQR
jgi:hypothetical protein